MSFQRRHGFLLAIDPDGCVFDTVAIKVKQCFIPEIVRCRDLQPLSRFVRPAAGPRCPSSPSSAPGSRAARR